jgi:hypothetical protein
MDNTAILVQDHVLGFQSFYETERKRGFVQETPAPSKLYFALSLLLVNASAFAKQLFPLRLKKTRPIFGFAYCPGSIQ